jgi:hypothetical protein
MKTEVSKTYKWGYVLSEQDLRRIVQTCQEHLSKLEINTPHLHVTAKLRDGALVETNDITDVISIENGGLKSIQRLQLVFDDGKEKSEQTIKVQFQDGWKNPDGWTSINYQIVGPSRDWAFIASSEIEDRIKKTKTTSYAYIVNHRWFLILPMLIGLVLMNVASDRLLRSKEPVTVLESAYRRGEVQNPIEALILLENTRNEGHMTLRIVAILLFAMLSPFALAAIAFRLAPRMLPSYNFYWGDYMATYDKRRGVMKIFWSVVVLGIIASLIAGLLLRVF